MDDRDRNGAPEPAVDGSDRLDSWKEIGAYLGRSVTTLQRWEASEGLPVRRLGHAKKGSVFALRSELDAWWRERTSGSPDPMESVTPGALPRHTAVAAPSKLLRSGVAIRTAVSVAVVILAMTVVGLTWALARVRGPVPETPTNLAVQSPEPGTVILLWTAASVTEDRFEIGRFGKIFGTVAPGFTSAEFKGLDAGTSYHWGVRACSASGCSPWHGAVGRTPDGADASGGVPDLPAVGDATGILFVSSRATGRSQIFFMQSDGSRVTRVTNSSANDWLPAWSPDRTRIAFSSDRTGAAEIYVMKADGSAVTNLTRHDPAQDHSPAWSPDGTQIAFVSTRSGDTDVWVMNADGSNPVNLTRSAGYNGQPSWSPDGKRIAFSSGRNGALDIYVMDADGSNRKRLTTDGARESSPAWGPDGRIAFQSTKDGNDEIYLIDADGSHETRVTNDPRADRSPTWSPDGSRIVFGSNRDGNMEIYSVKPDGSGLARLTKSPATDTEPAWGLLRPAARAGR
jgi:hypothetical protein